MIPANKPRAYLCQDLSICSAVVRIIHSYLMREHFCQRGVPREARDVAALEEREDMVLGRTSRWLSSSAE